MSKSVIVKCWVFRSSSGSGTYQTLLYNNGSTSCECPGWTRRVDALGKRSCKHTRSVDMGCADTEADSFKDYKPQAVSLPDGRKVKVDTVTVHNRIDPERMFNFDE